MTFSWVDLVAIVCGLAHLGVVIVRHAVKRHTPSMQTGITAVTVGAGLWYGVAMLLRPLVPAMRDIPIQPIAICIAGVAMIWVAVQSISDIWCKASIPHVPRGSSPAPTDVAPPPVPIADAGSQVATPNDALRQ